MELSVDPRNPGEVLACCGLAVLAASKDPSTITGFSQHGDGVRFSCPEMQITDIAGYSAEETPGGDVILQSNPDLGEVHEVHLDWWQPWGLNPEMKLWAGQQRAFTIASNLLGCAPSGLNQDWRRYEARTTGRLGVDPRGTWSALELGWSINEHKAVQMLCRPFVELLAFVGLQEFRLRRSKDRGFVFALWRPAPYLIARLAFGGHGRHVLGRLRATTAKSGRHTCCLGAGVGVGLGLLLPCER